MKKLLFSTITTFSLFSGACLFADVYSDMQSYKAGDSLAWFYDLRNQANDKAQMADIETKILDILSNKEISDGSFQRACEILKPIATKKSIPVLAKFLHNEIRATWACSVLQSLDTDDVEETIAKRLVGANTKSSMEMISTLASRGDDDSIEEIAKFLDASDKDLAVFSVYALGRFLEDDSVKLLSAIAKKNDYRAEAAYATLSSLAFNAFQAGEEKLAKKAIENVPASYRDSIVVRALLSGNQANKYLDYILASDCENVRQAARAMYKSRKFEQSAEIIKAFPKLSPETQLAVMGTFMESNDVRFYPTVAYLLDSSDRDLKCQSIYLGRFLCSDNNSFEKIYSMLNDKDKYVASLANNVFMENPTDQAHNFLKSKADGGDINALAYLIKRGDEPSREKLNKMYFGGEFKNTEVSKAMEETIVLGEILEFSKGFKSSDEALRKDIAKVIMRRLGREKGGSAKNNILAEIAKENISKEDPLYKVMVSKLSASTAKKKNVKLGG